MRPGSLNSGLTTVDECGVVDSVLRDRSDVLHACLRAGTDVGRSLSVAHTLYRPDSRRDWNDRHLSTELDCLVAVHRGGILRPYREVLQFLLH